MFALLSLYYASWFDVLNYECANEIRYAYINRFCLAYLEVAYIVIDLINESRIY